MQLRVFLFRPTLRGCTQGEEDPKRWSNFLLGLHAEILDCVVPKQRRIEKELKMMDKNKNAICALSYTVLNNQQSYHKYQLVVTPNEMVSLHCHDQPLFVPGTRIFQAKAVFMVGHGSAPFSTVLQKLVTFFIINIFLIII